jgi:hypothetical protein
MKFENEKSIPKETQEEQPQRLIKERLVAFINSGSIDSILRMKEKDGIPDEVMQSLEVQEAAKGRISSYEEQKRTEKGELMKEALGLPGDFYKPSESKKENPGRNTEDNEKNIEGIRESIREKIIEEVLEQGGFRVNMCFENIVAKGQTSDGFQTINEKIESNYRSNALSEIASNMTSESDSGSTDLRKIMKEHDINEVVDIRGVKERRYNKIKIPGKKGIFGFGKSEDGVDYVYDSNGKPKFTDHEFMHSELVENGKNELAIRITYFVKNEDWKSRAHGRSGQEMEIELIIPESIARGVEKELENDPGFIRKISGRVMKEKILKDPEAWDEPQNDDDKLKPQYEKWDAEEGGGRIYIQDERSVRGWNEGSIKSVKSTI